jgi:hypothetical protein
MNIKTIKVTAVISVLLFFSSGCSFYARIGSHQQGFEKMNEVAKNATDQRRADINKSDIVFATKGSLAIAEVEDTH